jgi:hypothetical protein
MIYCSDIAPSLSDSFACRIRAVCEVFGSRLLMVVLSFEGLELGLGG